MTAGDVAAALRVGMASHGCQGATAPLLRPFVVAAQLGSDAAADDLGDRDAETTGATLHVPVNRWLELYL